MTALFGEVPAPRTAPFRDLPSAPPKPEAEPEPAWLRDPEVPRDPWGISEKISFGIVFVVVPLLLLVLVAAGFVRARMLIGVGAALVGALLELSRRRR